MANSRNNIPAQIQARLTKLFVNNLPDRCSGSDLASVLRGMGSIYDIYIARKRNRAGKRFGFVSFLDVKDRKEFIKTLSSVRLGDFKLKFNIAKYVLEEGEIDQSKRDERNTWHSKPVGNQKFKPTMFAGAGGNNMSFKEASTGEAIGKTVTVDDSVEAFSALHGRSIFVRLKSLEVLKNIRNILKEMKLQEGLVRYMGGLSILIEFRSSDHALMAKDEMVHRKDCFEVPLIWEGQSIPFERVAWLKVVGLPFCIADSIVLNDIGSLFGMVVKEASVDDQSLDCSFHYVGVLVNHGKLINDVAFLRWRGKSFKVWVVETEKDWIGEFLEESGDNVFDSCSSPEEEQGAEKTPEIDRNPGVRKSGSRDINGVINGDSVSKFTGEVSKTQSQEVNGNYGMEENLQEGNNGNDQPISKNLKRKKLKSFINLGLDYSSGSSSGNLRPNKGPKRVEEDLFGLDPLIWADKSNVGRSRPVEFINRFSILSDSVQQSEGKEQGNGESAVNAPNINEVDGNNLKPVEEEINSTVNMGRRLGVELQNFQDLIRDSISKEGVQEVIQ